MKIGFIGAGNMAEAIIRGIIKSKIAKPYNIYASDINPKRLKYIGKRAGIKVFSGNMETAKNSDIIVLCVKPQNLNEVLCQMRDKITTEKRLISIAAGISLNKLQKEFKEKVSIVRVMPNTPALIGEGMSCISSGKYASKKDIKIAFDIFKSLGKVILVKEKFMDAITAISGSGPAYFYLFINILINSGVRIGLPHDIAKKLVNQTALGSVKMVINTREDLNDLINKVASKGGTTETALKYFSAKGFEKIIENAVRKAFLKSKELKISSEAG